MYIYRKKIIYENSFHFEVKTRNDDVDPTQPFSYWFGFNIFTNRKSRECERERNKAKYFFFNFLISDSEPV